MGVARGIGRALRQRQEWDRQARHERLQRDQLRRSEDREARDEERQAMHDALRREQHDWQRNAVRRNEEEYRRQRLGQGQQESEQRKFRFLADLEAMESQAPPASGIGAGEAADAAKTQARQDLIRRYGKKKWDDFDFSDDGGIEFYQGGQPVGRISGGERNAVREALKRQAEEAELASRGKKAAVEKTEAEVSDIRARPGQREAKERQQQERYEQGRRDRQGMSAAQRRQSLMRYKHQIERDMATGYEEDRLDPQVGRRQLAEIEQEQAAQPEGNIEKVIEGMQSDLDRQGISQDAFRKALKLNPAYKSDPQKLLEQIVRMRQNK